MSASTGRPYLWPNEMSDRRRPTAVPPPKESLILARSWWTLSREVSSTRSAAPRTSRSSSRAATMPSVTRPVPCSGCGRRSLSNRRTSVSSAASRNTRRAAAPRAASSLTADLRSVLNARLRKSMTAAIRDTAPLVLAARSTMVGSKLGGRLSTTYQPRSSSALAAVDRPAPDSPVMITTSVLSSAVRMLFSYVIGAQGRCDRSGELGADAGHGPDLLHARGAQLSHRAEVLEQRGAPGRAEPRHVVERAGRGRLAPLLPVVGDGEPVRLVPDPLQQVQALAAARQDDRVFLARQPHLFQALGQAAYGHVVDAEFGQGPRGRGGLQRPAVDHDQVGWIGEFFLSAHFGRFGGLGVAQRIQFAGLLAFVQVPAETAQDHLVDGRDVVGAVSALDREPAVLALAGQAVLEHDHRRDHVRTLQVRHVVALDPQRRVVQAEPLLDLVQRLAPGGQVAGPAGLVQGQGLGRGARHGLDQGLLVAALRDPPADRAPAAAGP